MSFRTIAELLVPALCLACRGQAGPGQLLCASCDDEIRSGGPVCGSPPESLDELTACAAHEGAARSLVASFKFRRLTGAAELIGSRMAELAGSGDRDRLIVPVPASSIRRRLRGFDPAALLAFHLAASTDPVRLVPGALRRTDSGRQRGRGRSGRLASPPRISSAGKLLGPVLLVDDVATTGATLSACARALLDGGATSVSAVTFTRRR